MTDQTSRVETGPTCECGMWPLDEYGERCPSCPDDDAFVRGLARDAARLGVLVSDLRFDDSFMATLSYRVDSAIAEREERLEALRAFRGRYSA